MYLAELDSDIGTHTVVSMPLVPQHALNRPSIRVCVLRRSGGDLLTCLMVRTAPITSREPESNIMVWAAVCGGSDRLRTY